MQTYNFTIKLQPWPDVPNSGVIEIDPNALYGHFERKSGAEGGGLWFERNKNGKLELIDYDGVFSLSSKVIAALRKANVIVDTNFE